MASLFIQTANTTPPKITRLISVLPAAVCLRFLPSPLRTSLLFSSDALHSIKLQVSWIWFSVPLLFTQFLRPFYLAPTVLGAWDRRITAFFWKCPLPRWALYFVWPTHIWAITATVRQCTNSARSLTRGLSWLIHLKPDHFLNIL